MCQVSRVDPYSEKKVIDPIFTRDGHVEIDTNDERCKIEIEVKTLQPGRTIWSDVFFVAIAQSGGYRLLGFSFASNLPEPKDFTLSIDAQVASSSMTVSELIALANDLED